MQRRLGLSLSNDARSCGASQDYLLGYVCYRCGKVKQTNFKVHSPFSIFFFFLFPLRQTIWNTSRGNKVICLAPSAWPQRRG